MSEAREFVCGKCGKGPVSGIYCEPCREALPVPTEIATRGLFPNEKCRFVWRGVEREGIIEKVMRENIRVLIELPSGKKKFLIVGADELLKEVA